MVIKYKANEWVSEFPGAVTVCGMDGKILEMNERSKETFSRDGGENLIGKDVRECHPPAARAHIDELLKTGGKNAYTIEKNGVHKIIYQAPWFKDGQRAGLIEVSLEIPENMKHFKRS